MSVGEQCVQRNYRVAPDGGGILVRSSIRGYGRGISGRGISMMCAIYSDDTRTAVKRMLETSARNSSSHKRRQGRRMDSKERMMITTILRTWA